jgi:hypothetical protein
MSYLRPLRITRFRGIKSQQRLGKIYYGAVFFALQKKLVF